MISSVYDSLGVVVPYTLKGKKLPQKLCQDEVGCDETPPGKIIKEHWVIQKVSSLRRGGGSLKSEQKQTGEGGSKC